MPCLLTRTSTVTGVEQKKKKKIEEKEKEERERGREKQKIAKKRKGCLCFTVESRPLIDESVKTTFVEARSCSKVIPSLVLSFHVSL